MTRLPVASARDTLRTVGRLLARRRGRLAATVLLLLSGSAAALAIPPVLGAMVDLVIDRASVELVIFAGIALSASGMVAAACTWWGGRLLVSCVQSTLAELREEVFATAVRLDTSAIERAGTSDVVSRLTGDVEAVTEAASGVLPRFIGALFTIVLTAFGMAAVDPALALAALVAVPVQLIAVVRFLRRSRPLYVRVRRQESDRGQAIIETVTGADTVRAHATQADRLTVIARRSLASVETQRQAAKTRNVFNGTLNLAEFLGLAAILTAGLWRVESAGVTIGAVTAAALFFHRLFGPIGALLSSIDDLQRAHAGLERLVGVLQAAPARRTTQPIHDASVQLRGVTYSYPGASSTRPSLNGVDLVVPAGATAVLVGASGSGKSTTALLIAGLIEPSAGDVLIGGIRASEAARDDGRPAVVLATQDLHLFAGTLRDNLRLARDDASDDDLWDALDTVGADWTRALPAGLDTVVGHDFDQLRIQQLALARVLIADPPVVVLDEPTAHAGADGALDRALRAATDGRTAIVVAHRLSHAEHADLVAVFERGRVTEQGTVLGLLESSETFIDLWSAWTSAHTTPTPTAFPEH